MEWKSANIVLFIVEICVLIFGILYFSVKKKRNKITDCILFAVVAVLNFFLYLIPVVLYDGLTTENTNYIYSVMVCFSATLKQLVGEFAVDKVSVYTAAYPEYSIIFLLGGIMAVASSFMAVLTLAGAKVRNFFKVSKRLRNKKYCDIILGYGKDALKYAESNDNCVIAVDAKTGKEIISSLIQKDYAVLTVSSSLKFLKSSLLNKKTRYNFIRFEGGNEVSEEIKNFISYLKDGDKNIRYFVEVNEKRVIPVRDQIELWSKDSDVGEKIVVFSKNELLARRFVAENPLTLHMPSSYIDTENAVVKTNIRPKVFFLGFGALNEEIYKQFVCNNQLAVNENGRYRVLPVEYKIYSKGIDEREWHIKGLNSELEELKKEKEEYFALPDRPYNANVIKEDHFYIEIIKNICEEIKESYAFSYIILDTGDEYENADIGKKFIGMLGASDKYHLYINDETNISDNHENITCFGDSDQVLQHNIIVNESLMDAAKYVNAYYALLREHKEEKNLINADIADIVESEWKKLDFFSRYSNIFLVNNLRFKLNMIGFDYHKASSEEVYKTDYIEKIKGYINKSGRDYLKVSPSSAMIAAEHFRWNAYHFMNGYLPMKKSGLEFNKETGKVINKNHDIKKHGCIASFYGVQEIADAVNLIYEKEGSARREDYYIYDNLLLEAAPSFIERNGFIVTERK